ncbi:Uncharacterised protein [Mycolicibacter terrae]|nr:Uncharacterised protein [Mycolicibacter terrae]
MRHSRDIADSGMATETVDKHHVSHQTDEFSALMRRAAERGEGWVSNL